MAITDLTTRTLVRFEGDTSGLKAKITELEVTERKLTDSRVAGLKASNKAIDDLIDKFGSLDGTVERSKRAWENMSGAAEKALGILRDDAKHARLEAAAAGVDIEKLGRATKGLALDSQLLADAARLNHGAFKLEAEQMASVEAAMQGLNARGYESQKVHEAVLQAVTALKDDGLKDLGIFIDKAGLSMDKESDRAEVLKRILAELSKVSREFGSAQLTAADQTEKAAVTIENALDKIKRKGAELAVQAGKGIGIGGGMLAESMMRFAGVDVDSLKDQGSLSLDVANLIGRAQLSRKRAQAMIDKDYAALAGMGVTIPVGPDTTGASYKVGRLDKQEGPTVVSTPMGDFDAKAAAEKWMDVFRSTVKTEAAPDDGLGFIKPGSTSLGRMAPGGIDVFGADVTGSLNKAIDDRQTRNWKDELGYQGKERTSVFEKTFGKLSDFSVYKAAWDGLSSSVVAGYDAMVTGSMRWRDASKMAAAGALKALGASLQVEALKETAAAFASIALGPIGGASAGAHFQAAALYEAGAIAAGLASHSLGGGVAPKSPATSPGIGSAPGAGTTGVPSREAGGNTRTVYHIIGDPFDMESNPRRRLNNAREINKRLDRDHYAADY